MYVCMWGPPYRGEVLHGQLVQRDVLRLCLEDGFPGEPVGLPEGHLGERHKVQPELDQPSLTPSHRDHDAHKSNPRTD